MALFRRPRLFEPAGSKGFQVRLAPEARDWVVGLADELEALLVADTEDTRRLFPTAYPDDPDRDAGYQILAREQLIDDRRDAIALMRTTVAKSHMTVDELGAWMRIVNDLRLVLGTRLDVSEEDDEIDVDGPDLESQLIYRELGYLLSEIVDAMTTTLP
ncbi:MAG: DUF2017 family protein [Acidimicrobiales bacterium]